jgi:hypothetical protein
MRALLLVGASLVLASAAAFTFVRMVLAGDLLVGQATDVLRLLLLLVAILVLMGVLMLGVALRGSRVRPGIDIAAGVILLGLSFAGFWAFMALEREEFSHYYFGFLVCGECGAAYMPFFAGWLLGLIGTGLVSLVACTQIARTAGLPNHALNADSVLPPASGGRQSVAG